MHISIDVSIIMHRKERIQNGAPVKYRKNTGARWCHIGNCYNTVCVAMPENAKRVPFRLILEDRPSVTVWVDLPHCRAPSQIHNRQYGFPYRTFKRYGAVRRTVCTARDNLGSALVATAGRPAFDPSGTLRQPRPNDRSWPSAASPVADPGKRLAASDPKSIKCRPTRRSQSRHTCNCQRAQARS